MTSGGAPAATAVATRRSDDCSSAIRRCSRSSAVAWSESRASSPRPAKMIPPTVKNRGTTMSSSRARLPSTAPES